MGLFFRKRIKLSKLLNLNLSKSGFGFSFGVKGLRISENKNGVYLNAGRNGLYFRKKITSSNSKGQNYYENIFNFIEAKNNDGSNKLNKATYSTELITKLLNIYFKKGDLIYDPFMGTGTTANACILYNCNYIGSEISKSQCEYAEERIKETQNNKEIE